jgi:hypothetical protein
VTSRSIIHTNLHKLNNKLVNVWLEHFWCTDEPWAYTDSQDSSWPGLGGNHHFAPYSIFYTWPWGLHPNVILSREFKLEVLKFPKLGLLRLWKPINFYVDLRLRWGLKKISNPCQDLFNNMSYATYTQVN